MKSILIVTEQFTLGGLETHIQGEIRHLAEQGVAAHLASGSVFDGALLPPCVSSVCSDIPLGPSASAEGLLIAIHKLRTIIREHDIDAVHIHPFTSIIPAVVAAELEAVPYVITLHGPASLESYGPIYDILTKEIVFANTPLIVAVSPEVESLVSPHALPETVVYIPNSVSFIETDTIVPDHNVSDPRWLVVSRLDAFKIVGILDFCIKAQKCGIPGVLIVGDGSAKSDLSQALAIHGLSDFVELAGARSDVAALMRCSSGVAGMGRVLLEGIAAKKPVVLVGYDGVKGVVDAPMLKCVARSNFSGRGLPTLDLAEFSYQIRSRVKSSIVSENFLIAKESFNETESWSFFMRLLAKLGNTKRTVITAFYHSLEASTIKEDMPYLQNMEIMDRLIILTCSKNYYDDRLLAVISLHRHRFETALKNQAVSELNVEIVNLSHAVADKERQISNLSQVIADKEGQISKLSQVLADKEGHISNLSQVIADKEGHISNLSQVIADKEGQISKLSQVLADKEGHISNLSQVIADKKGQIVDISRAIADEQHKYQKTMNSYSIKIAKAFRAVRSKVQAITSLSRSFFQVLRSHGPLMALIQTKKFLLYRQTEINSTSKNLKMSNQEIYLLNKSMQNQYVTKYIEDGLDESHLLVLANVFLDRIASDNKILVLPLSYPLELTQRPDHIVRYFSERGYLCVMLQIDSSAPFFKQIGENRYLTNVFAGVVCSLAHRKNVVLYLTYPFFGYLIDHLPQAQCLYDVLDELSVFSLNCKAMLEDHQKLLTRASAVMFSSKELMKNNSFSTNKNIFLVKNGVWVNDFSGISENIIQFNFEPDSFIVGYHGAISELLDWPLLEKIASIQSVKVVMIGPLVEFEGYSEQSIAVRDRVLRRPNVLHVQAVPYADLKGYLKNFSIGLVPFIVNEKTNPVLPLKLFEYMAIGLPICATNTSTLLDYNDCIFVGSSDEILAKIKAMTDSEVKLTHVDYKDTLEDADWARQVAPVTHMLDFSFYTQKDSERATLKKVDIVNINFFDWDGNVLYKGGAERYVFDLACLMRDLGWSARILQNANRDFHRDFRGIPVLGVKTDSGGDIKLLSKKFRELCKDADLVIASPADLACNLVGLKVIGINHGIYWDHKFKRLENNNTAEYKNIFDSLRLAARVVAVDTNFINWTRTYDYSLAGKLTYVPNYFDSSVFHSHPKEFSKNIRVLYPRRLYEARGIFITLKAFGYLFPKYPELELHLVGQANEEDRKVVLEFIESYPGRVVWEEFDMDEMHTVYQKSHIVLVPTLYAEGTSLSCIEAMATNNALIATNIGGLPNLVVDGFNGFLINPTANNLAYAIESLLSDREAMKIMAAKGLEMSEVFEKSNWVSRWKKVIAEVLQ